MELEHLILDTNFFVNRSELVQSKNYYTTPSVIAEVKDENSKLYLETFQSAHNLLVVQPDRQNYNFVVEQAYRLNQFGQLSRPDMEVIALGVQLAKQLNIQVEEVQKLDKNQLKIKSDALNIQQNNSDEQLSCEPVYQPNESSDDKEASDPIFAALKALTEMNKQHISTAPWQSVHTPQKPVEVKSDKPDLSFGDGWITKENIEEKLINNPSDIKLNEISEVLAIYTEDKGMQNIILAIKLQLINSSKQRITEVKRFALKCSSCLQVYLDTQEVLDYARNLPYIREFHQYDQVQVARKLMCPKCSNQGLMRVAVYIEDGVVSTSKGIKHFDLKGTVYNLADLTKKRFAGYKQPHLLHPELYEERQIKMAKYQKKQRGMEFGDDLMKGVGKAQVEQDVAYFLKRNPNVRPMKQMRK
ncbi:rRNA-binding endoribonuclease [Spironucleus salmonicida]|uniref:Nin one binding protein-like protein n=1 Tax=Spironucleus salmonicida TaxID=348837 RepID=V6LTG6_9EUKA|nr:rRNA-binding endoribonuclease [Spironucleus salmonicida]|eukprot:EST46986.1 Nin one binding protein-like protein [Spironucleus salmonicida]